MQAVPAVLFADVLALAVEKGAGIYADIKDTDATLPTLEALKSHGIERAILGGAFDPRAARLLEAAGSPPYPPRSVLVPLGVDPFEFAQGADVIHLCWEHMERPQDALTPEFFAEANRRGQKVVLWHEEDPDRMAVLRELPVLGICSDRPELVHPFRAPADWPLEIACHRGGPVNSRRKTLCRRPIALLPPGSTMSNWTCARRRMAMWWYFMMGGILPAAPPLVVRCPGTILRR